MQNNIISMLSYEEGWSSKPYLCSERYPTVGYGFKIGPQGADIKQYKFTLPVAAGKAWLDEIVKEKLTEMMLDAGISSAMNACDGARQAVLVSMSYQMGVAGLAGFRNTLKAVAEKRWNDAAKGMLDSRWAKQTPNRAKRHSEQMLSGVWAKEYGNGNL